jgi:membrane associated rhomboid family serine protease
MFLPLRDALPSLRFPVVTVVLIAINIVVYVMGLLPADAQVAGSSRTVTRHDLWVVEYGTVPCELLGKCGNQAGSAVVDGGILDPTPRTVLIEVEDHPPILTLFTSMFLHGGILHLAFNMLFLWVYGNNVEDAMHPLGFLAFYIFGGLVSAVAQCVITSGAMVPLIGASGAIATVIGGYMLLYPRARIQTFPLVFLWLPAWFVAGFWFIQQFLATWQKVFAPITLVGGTANMAHVAGFVVGLLLVKLLAERRNPVYDELYRDGAH